MGRQRECVCVGGCENHAMNLWMDENIIYMNKLDVILIIYKSQSDKIHRNTKHKKQRTTSLHPTKSLPMTLIHVFEQRTKETKKNILLKSVHPCFVRRGKKKFAKQAARFIFLVFFLRRRRYES